MRRRQSWCEPATIANASISRSNPFCVFRRPAATTSFAVWSETAASPGGSGLGIRSTRVGPRASSER